MATFTELFERLDPDDNVRGRQFERICKWYLQHDPVYAGQLTNVIVDASPAAQPGVFHAEKHCLDSFLVAQRPVVGFCERVDDHPAHSDVGGAEKSGSDIVSPCTTILAGWMPFATATASSSLVRTSVARACFLTHRAS